MTLQELQNRKRMVRVVDSTYYPNNKTIKMIGGEFEVEGEDYKDKAIAVYNKDKSDYWDFNRSDVVELTPISFEGKGIAIGDEIKGDRDWYTVIGFYWMDEWRLVVVMIGSDLESDCYNILECEITAHRIPNSENLIGEIIEIKYKGQTHRVKVIG